MTSKSPLIIPAHEGLHRAVQVIKAGGIVAYPTETFYALGVDPANTVALKRLFHLKGRPAKMAMPLIAGDMMEVRAMAHKISHLGELLFNTFWPGPLTLIFEAAENTPKLLTGDKGGIGVRISAYPLCERLTGALGHALTSTSANPTGTEPALDAMEVRKYFSDRVDLIIDGKRLTGGMASTVVDVRGDKPIILREGVVKAGVIFKALEKCGEGD